MKITSFYILTTISHSLVLCYAFTSVYFLLVCFLTGFFNFFVLKGIFYLIVLFVITFSLHLFNFNSFIIVILTVLIADRAVCYIFTQVASIFLSLQ